MYRTKSNAEIGAFLKGEIEIVYKTQREFAKNYVKYFGENPEDKDEINRVYNKINDIVNGKKGIQLEDFPAFEALLGLNCDLILSAGTYTDGTGLRDTNYKIAFSKDIEEWENFVNRPDKLILNNDEYGKNVIDYLIENNNYEMFKYLLEKKYLIFESKNDKPKDLKINVEGRKIAGKDLLVKGLDPSYRTKVIMFAIRNEDIELLKSIRAREMKYMYGFLLGPEDLFPDNTSGCTDEKLRRELIETIANSNKDIIDYFTEEFEVKLTGDRNVFMFPFTGEVLTELVKKKSPYAIDIAGRCMEHNCNIIEYIERGIDYFYKKLVEYCEDQYIESEYTDKEKYIKGVCGECLRYKKENHCLEFLLNKNVNIMLLYSFNRYLQLATSSKGEVKYDVKCNFIRIDMQSDDEMLNMIINKSNEAFDKIERLGSMCRRIFSQKC